MTRRTEVVKLDEGFLVKGWAKTEEEAAALQFALIGVPTGAALFSNAVTVPEEPWPSDADAKWLPESGTEEPNAGTAFPPNCDGLNCADVLTERTAGDD